MTDKTKEQIAELEKTVGDLTKQLETALKAAPTDVKKAAETQKALDEATAAKDDLTKQLAEAKAANEELTVKASLTADEQAYYDGIKDPEKKKEFMAMKPAERAALLNKAKAADEVIKVGDREIKKSVVGEDQFAVIKSQQEEITKNRDELAKAQEKADFAVLEKRAETELKGLPGDTKARAKMLQAVEAIKDETVRKSFTDLFTAHEKIVKAAFDTVGTKNVGGSNASTPEIQKASTEFDGKVAEIAKRDNITKHQAMSKARKEHPELYKQYQGETVEAH